MAKIFRLEDLSARPDFAKSGGFKLWTLTFDLPGEKVNKLGKAVLDEIGPVLDELEKRGREGQIEALALISGKPGQFIAGADIEMLQACQSSQEAQAISQAGQALMNRWEDLPFPTVACVAGPALGGGAEFCLASSAIVMSQDPATRIGLPEVMLGLIPGSGGCVRLPRKVGLAGAFDLILTGKALTAERALKAGLIEAALAAENFHETAYAWIKSNLARLRSGERIAREPKLGGMGGVVGAVMEKTPVGRAIIFKKAREGVLAKTHGHYPSPLEAIAVVQKGGGAYGPKVRGARRERAMQLEAEAFGRLAAGEVSKNLIRIFFMTEKVKKSKGVESVSGAKTVHAGAVLGAGVMGGGIAQLLADKNVSARMKDVTPQALTTGVQSAAIIFKKQLKRRRITPRQYQQKLNLIAPTLDYAGFGGVEVVVEAIVENMDVKKKVLAELEGQVGDACVIASNTSSLSISEMQKAFKKPERFAGMHFFNPVAKMPLVEVIRGARSSDDAVSAIYQFSKQLGKTPIVVKDSPGFLVNRLLMPYLNEATYLLGEGVPVEDLDRVLLDFGMPMGPMELIDEVGVDVGDKVSHILNQAFGDRMVPAPVNEKVVKAGRLGKKAGKGIYKYEDEGGGRLRKALDPEIYALIGVDPKPGAISDEEILERCVLPMINEAARCLEEGVVASAWEADLGMIMGTGFPPFRGGLLKYADTLGAKSVVERLKKYQAQFGARFEPAKPLLERAQGGRTFH